MNGIFLLCLEGKRFEGLTEESKVAKLAREWSRTSFVRGTALCDRLGFLAGLELPIDAGRKLCNVLLTRSQILHALKSPDKALIRNLPLPWKHFSKSEHGLAVDGKSNEMRVQYLTLQTGAEPSKRS